MAKAWNNLDQLSREPEIDGSLLRSWIAAARRSVIRTSGKFHG